MLYRHGDGRLANPRRCLDDNVVEVVVLQRPIRYRERIVLVNAWRGVRKMGLYLIPLVGQFRLRGDVDTDYRHAPKGDTHLFQAFILSMCLLVHANKVANL